MGCRVVCKASDSSAFRALSQKAGLGKQKHVRTKILWIQEQVEQGRVGIERVGANQGLVHEAVDGGF
eukprot:4206968-Amphidinium_carterae.1